MVAVLVRLKLSLLRNTLKQSVWRVVGLVLAAIGAIFTVGLVVAGLIAARLLEADDAAAVLTLAGAALLLGWIFLPLLLFGADETLDPSRFALLPLTARQLLPGLLAAAAIGVPGISTIVIVSATVVTWSRGPIEVLVSIVAAALGILLCLTSARVLTSAFAGILISRKYQDLASLLLFGVIMVFALGTNAFNVLLVGSGQQVVRQLVRASEVIAWTPLGWAWSAPADAATGHLAAAGIKLVLCAVLLVLLIIAWHVFLSRSLTSAVPVGAAGRTKAAHSLVDKITPDTAVGATAARSLRYLRRDPRYTVSLAGVVLAPLAIVVANVTTGVGTEWVVWVPVLLAAVVSMSACQELSFDGSAFWTQISTGVSGRDDLLGRALATCLWSGPLLLIVAAGSAAWSGRWDLVPGALGLAVAMLFGGVGIAMAVSARWQGPVAPPGANPFGGNSGSSIESFLAILFTTIGTAAIAAPVAVLVIAAIWAPALAWVAMILGPAWVLIALRQATQRGGRYLDAHGRFAGGRLGRPGPAKTRR
ncbi:transporter [soil metagenome]